MGAIIFFVGLMAFCLAVKAEIEYRRENALKGDLNAQGADDLLDDLWSHHLIKLNGLEKPLEEIELEEVSAEEVPAFWRVEYNESKTQFVTIEIKP